MSGTIFKIRSFLRYWLDAVDEHSLHSPFFFDLYTGVIRQRSQPDEVAESLRAKLLADHREIVVNDLGARGPSLVPRKVSDIAARSLSAAKFSSLYRRLIARYNYLSVVELGTSFGINTLYLAARKEASVTTFEGAQSVADIATLTFDFAGAKNVRLIQGDIGTMLPNFLQGIRKLDFAFIDANHRLAPTVSYFRQLVSRVHERSIIVVDDIHASQEMEQAWAEIKNHALVHGSADLYRCGLLFFDPSLNKRHVILQF